MRFSISHLLLFLALLLLGFSAQARNVPKDLPYPSGTPSAYEIAEQVYFVNHFYATKNYAIGKKGRTLTVLINKAAGGSPTTVTLERYLNNGYNDGVYNSKDLAIFRSGKLRGTGMLITDFAEEGKSQLYAIWLPALRKIRRFAEPAHDDAWGGSDFTFGDVTLRKPDHENHELLGTERFNDCLGVMELERRQRNRYMRNLPGPACEHKGSQVYKLKSSTKRSNWWYDYRISYIDTKTFADYRTDYFKSGKQIKVIDRHWVDIDNISDPRGLSWGYWYGRDLGTGHETWAVIPQSVVKANDRKLKEDLWSEKTLRRIRR